MFHLLNPYTHSIQKNYPIGAKRVVSGKLEYFNGMWQMSHPEYTTTPDKLKMISRLEPVYPLTAGVTNKLMCKVAEDCLARLPKLPEWQSSEYQNTLKNLAINPLRFWDDVHDIVHH